MSQPIQNLQRLLSPKSIAFVGGTVAEMAIKPNVTLGYGGEIWPVHPTRTEIAGFQCYSSIDDLPYAPDAAFIGVKRELTIEIVGKLSEAGAGGCVCYAAGFSEMGGEGQQLQEQLVKAAGTMPLVGPNCFGVINYVDKCCLWPYLFGGEPVERGVALISQSGNIAMNLTMNKRSVNFTHVICAGNQAVSGPADYIDALLQDDRVTAIGMYIEGIDDIEHFSRSALRALEYGIPIVALKVGKTAASAEVSSSHTSSLTGSDVLFDALFDQLGIIRVNSLNALLETLKALELSKPLNGRNIFTLSCSGGEAAIIADVVDEYGLETRPFSASQISNLEAQFPNYVTVSNPFDYNTSVWGDQAAQERCFTEAMKGDHDAAVLIYDHPTINAREVDEWVMALDAFIAAHNSTGMPAFVICTISELMSQDMREKLIKSGVVPLMGLDDGLFAISAVMKYREFFNRSDNMKNLPLFATTNLGKGHQLTVLDESQSKSQLRDFGMVVPEGEVGSSEQVCELAERIGYPVVVKACGEQFLHKSDLGAVRLNLSSPEEVRQAVLEMSDSVAASGFQVNRFLVEKMTTGAVAELIIGIKRDDQFGPALVIGAGGLLVELIADSESLLLPTTRAAVTEALHSLSVSKLIRGYRGNPVGDMNAIIDAVLSVAKTTGKVWSNWTLIRCWCCQKVRVSWQRTR